MLGPPACPSGHVERVGAELAKDLAVDKFSPVKIAAAAVNVGVGISFYFF
jgi:hypothetical protein